MAWQGNYASAFSLAGVVLDGVVLGGVLTAFTQHAAQRSADRAEERRQSIATTELRRAEQVQAIKDFLACVQDAERAAYTHPEPWGADEDGWLTTAQTVMGNSGRRIAVSPCSMTRPWRPPRSRP
ncbi:hypothetical protein [Streptomyces sp. NPDC001657]|uniref:hypothetical protein n=1 Tax=Streptomyces sp. NPDC001657 TaxID=3154522 RepID=UPI003325BF1B